MIFNDRYLIPVCLSLAQVLFLNWQIQAQVGGNEVQYGLPKIEDLVKIPNSPEAQAFARYGNTPVNLYTGSPDVNLPIHTLQGRELSLPISLSYDASGLKVEQIATSAGLGWNFNAGGMVTRNVRAFPDDYLSSTPAYIPFYEQTANLEYEFVKNFTAFEGQRYQPGLLGRYFTFLQLAIKSGFENRYELQPDTYSFSVNGLSGTLVIDYQNISAYCIEHPDIKAIPIFSVASAVIKVIESWMITDREGNLYVFAAPETTTVDEHNSYDGGRTYYSAWALTSIISKSKKDRFEFHWADQSWNQPKLAGRADYRLDIAGHNTPCGSDQMVQPQNSPTYSINQKELREIWMNEKKAIVVTGKPRNDLSGKQAIDNVLVLDQDERQVSRFRMIHSYFGTTSTTNEGDLRLRLDGFEVYGDATSADPLRYAFLYHDSGSLFPSRESFAQDFWGYFNGASGNSTLIPYNRTFDETNARYLGWRGANRVAKSDFAKIGTLRTIVYPTRGSTEFEYEGHRVNTQIASLENSTQPVMRGYAGLTGGTTPDNPFNFCDDVIAKPPYPRGTDVLFTVPATGAHEVRFLVNGVQGGNTTMQYAALYRSDDGASKDFCELYQSATIIQYYGTYPDGTNAITPISLDAGTYRILLMNNSPNVTIELQVWGNETVQELGDPFEAGGLRIKKIVDMDENGKLVSARAFYYGDLSTVPASSISEAFILGSNLNSGTLHHTPLFESTRVKRVFEQVGQVYLEHNCYSTTRTSNSAVNANLHVTYPVVTEVQLGGGGGLNGFTIFEFANTYPDAYTEGFSKASILNGRILKKRIFNSSGQILSQEENFYSQRAAGGGIVGYYFRQNAEIGREDLYVKYAVNQPSEEFFEYQPMGYTGIGSAQEQHCYLSGDIVVFFDCVYLGTPTTGVHVWNCDGAESRANLFKQDHPGAIETWETSLPGFMPPWKRIKLTAPHHVIINCRFLDGEWQKVPYSFPRYWATTDSTRVTQFNNGARHQVVTRTFYDNLSHFQPTRSISRDSKGVVRTMRFSYPHDMQTTEPQTPAWNSLIAAHRISEQLQVESTFGSGQPDFRQQVQYKSVPVNNEPVFMPDVTFLASGSSPLEPRIRVHKYDGKGNVIEVSRENDTRTVYLWGYNAQYPIAVIQNANAEEVFFSSFEEEDRSSVVGDAFCGQYSRINGFVKELSNLVPGKPYNLSFWRKVGSIWQFSSQEVVPVNTNFLINLSGQIDDVRFLPQNAQMVTYTYKPGVGITSTCDANGVPTFYDYDPLNRLWLVRDRFKNILKENTYHYKK